MIFERHECSGAKHYERCKFLFNDYLLGCCYGILADFRSVGKDPLIQRSETRNIKNTRIAFDKKITYTKYSRMSVASVAFQMTGIKIAHKSKS